jgi:hypothetical protein
MTVDMGMTWVKYYLHHYDSGHGNDMGYFNLYLLTI